MISKVVQQQQQDQRSSSASESIMRKNITRITHMNSYEQDISKNQSFRIIKMLEFQENRSHALRAEHLYFWLHASHELERSSYGIDREKLQQDLQICKQEVNAYREENIRLKTKLAQGEKELAKYERLFEENQLPKIPQKSIYTEANPSMMMINLRKQVKELNNEIKERNKEVEQMKKSIKVTKVQELENEKKIFFEETVRLKGMLNVSHHQISQMSSKLSRVSTLEQDLYQSLQIQETLQSKNASLLEQFTKKEGSSAQQQVKFQQQNSFLSLRVKQLEQRIKKLEQENYRYKNSVSVERSHSQQQTKRDRSLGTESKVKKQSIDSSSRTMDVSLRNELRYKLILRGVQHSQFLLMMEDLREQTRQLQQPFGLNHLTSILAQQPFNFTDFDKIDRILKQLKPDDVIGSFQNFIGQYKTFFDYPEFQLEADEQYIQKCLQDHKTMIDVYWKKHKGKITLADFERYVASVKLNLTEHQQLFYTMTVFESAEEMIEQIPLQLVMEPFATQQQLEQESFLRDLKEGENNPNEQLDLNDNRIPTDRQMVVNNYYPMDQEDLQFHQSLKLKQFKYLSQQTYEIREEDEEKEHENDPENDFLSSKRQSFLNSIVNQIKDEKNQNHDAGDVMDINQEPQQKRVKENPTEEVELLEPAGSISDQFYDEQEFEIDDH